MCGFFSIKPNDCYLFPLFPFYISCYFTTFSFLLLFRYVHDLEDDPQDHQNQSEDEEAEPPERRELSGGLLSEHDPVIVPREYERDRRRPNRPAEPHDHAYRAQEEAGDGEDHDDDGDRDVLHVVAKVTELVPVRQDDGEPLAGGVQDAWVRDHDVEGDGYPPNDHHHRVVRKGLEEVPFDGLPAVEVPQYPYAEIENGGYHCAENTCLECPLLLVNWP